MTARTPIGYNKRVTEPTNDGGIVLKILKVKCLAPTRLDHYLMQQYPALTPGRLIKPGWTIT